MERRIGGRGRRCDVTAILAAGLAGVAVLAFPAWPTVIAPAYRDCADRIRHARTWWAGRGEEARLDLHHLQVVSALAEWTRPEVVYRAAVRAHGIARDTRAARLREAVQP